MERILSIGSKLDFADHVGWHENVNYKDYNIMFMNLRDLENRSGQFFHPYFGDFTSVNFPTRKQVRSFVLEGGNDLIVVLPSSPEIELQGENQSKPQSQQSSQIENVNSNDSTDRGLEFFSCNVLRWLPVNVTVEAMSGESVSLPIETETPDYWDWYFDRNFGWNLTIQNIGQWSKMRERSMYTNPNTVVRSGSRNSEKHGPLYRLQTIARNASNECIAARIELFPRRVDKSRLEEYNLQPGAIYLIPLKPQMAFSDFARQVLLNNYDLLDEGVEHQPDWVRNYSLPEETRIRERISKLESELNELNDQIEEPAKYKPLLYEIGNPLEDLVHETLSEVGLEVGGEIPGKRDGVIKLSDQWISLEIFGSVNGVKARKYRQLTDWVENVQVDHPDKDVEGLLVANTFAEDDPEERPPDLLQGDPKRLMEQRGFHAISTIDIYRMICGYRNGDLMTRDIEEMFSDMDELILDFKGLPSDPI
jgi:hypothetical protein